MHASPLLTRTDQAAAGIPRMTRRALVSDFAVLASHPTAGLVVGCSGGLDSIALLHSLAASPEARQRNLRAVHVHHGLHADADAWAMHCQRVCTALDVALRIVHVDVPRTGGEGLEAAARRVRHAALQAELAENEVLALAHHRDDQAETFLLRALRGSGPDGLGAMRPWRRFGCGWLWRPLLHVPRAQLLAYAQRHGLQWIEDPGNADVAFDRNFLRHRVLPLLRERWPQADAALARSAGLSAQACGLLADQDASALAAVRSVDPKVVEVADLRSLPAARRARVLRRWIDELGLPPLPAQGVDRIETDLLRAAPDATAAFAWSNAVIRHWRGRLHADRQREPLPVDWQAEWNALDALVLPTGDTLALIAADDVVASGSPLVVHARRGGERIRLPGRSHSHTLKHVLQALGVPPWIRVRLPLLSDASGELLAAGDLVYSAKFEAWLREHNARLLWEKGVKGSE